MFSNIPKTVCYIYSKELIGYADQNPAVLERASMVHELIKSYKLLNELNIKSPKKCDYDDLRIYHTSDYLNTLKEAAENDEDSFVEEEAGLGFDCPVWKSIYDYVLSIAGGSLEAAKEIKTGTDIVLNWTGGWHHARAENASGYCYVNDIILCILSLRQTFQRILYIDLDAHHGDAVEDAFSTTKRVFTVSFHQHEPGFYPGTGSVNDCGFGASRGYSVNFPYKSGLSGNYFKKYFKKIIGLVIEKYQPEILVLQCGGDVITGDPLTETNLVPEDIGYCLKYLLEKNLPMIVFGGGGYNLPNTSRYWTYLTSIIINKSLNDDIPDNQYFLSYGPDYEIKIERKLLKDSNTEEYLTSICEQIEDNLRNYTITAI